ncbi:hypothetical protein CF64_44155 [Bradyrhizobium japonicum]|nr:hypothetical protein CF64_44155 [Bradyrhizobium japonicum]
MATPNLVGELRLINRVVETCDADVGGSRVNAFLIHQLNAIELENLLETLDGCGIARQAIEMLNDHNIKIMVSHAIEQLLIAVPRIFG